MICGRCHKSVYKSVTKLFAHWRAGCGPWARVVELRRAGRADAADRETRRILGPPPEPMSEETKARLRAYAEEHRDEIRAAVKARRAARARLRAAVAAVRRKR